MSVIDERMAQIMELIEASEDGIARSDLMKLWGVRNAKTARLPFEGLRNSGKIACTTHGGKPRWTTPDKVEILAAKLRETRRVQEMQKKRERQKIYDARNLETRGTTRPIPEDNLDMPIVQRVVRDWSLHAKPAIASVWDLAK